MSEPSMEYSVIIRTIGKSGEKYQKLLSSVRDSDCVPKEVIVVLPEGCDPPRERLGGETFVFCPRGMVRQRLTGIAQCKTPYALILDDDIAFSSDFVTKVSAPVVSGEYGISAGPLTEFFPTKGKSALFAALMGESCPTVFHGKRYNTVLKTTGYSYQRRIEKGKGRLYETQSAPWTCFFADVRKLRSIHFEDESWLDSHGYSAYDDTAMFYKAWLCGVKTVIVADAAYRHLDAGTARIGDNTNFYFSRGFNAFVLWKRLLCHGAGPVRRFFRWFPFRYHELTSLLFHRLKSGRACAQAYRNGCREARRWVKSEEYRRLPALRH